MADGQGPLMDSRDADEIQVLRRALARAQAELRACEARYRTVTRATNDAVYDWEPATGALTWNEGLRTSFGYMPAEIEQNIAWWKDKLHPDDRARVVAALDSLRQGDGYHWYDEYRYRRADGSYAEVVDRGIVIRDLKGKATRMIGTMVDTTELKQAQARLALAARLASVGTLAAGVAHEINNPLAFIIANLDASIRRLGRVGRHAAAGPGDAATLPRGDVGELLALLEDAREGAERVRLIVRDLTTFARAEEERQGPVDVARVLDSCVQMAMNQIRHRARVVRDYASVPPIEANEARLGQVFLNLVVNAAQAIPEGAADRNEIALSTRLDAAGRVVVAVRDTGTGIPPESLGRIFDPFYTSKGAGEGLGLGLAICHSIVSALGGEISVESQPGEGSTFRVTLPASLGDTPPVSVDDAAPAASAPRRRGRVLVIDDEPLLGRAIASTLEPDHETVTTRSAREALARLQAGERYDVILCDLIMPELTGMDFYEALIEVAPDQRERIIFLTGGAFTERARSFLEVGDRRVLVKPFDAAALLSAISEVMSAPEPSAQ